MGKMNKMLMRCPRDRGVFYADTKKQDTAGPAISVFSCFYPGADLPAVSEHPAAHSVQMGFFQLEHQLSHRAGKTIHVQRSG